MNARKDAKTGKTKTVSYGFVGRWSGGDLGWFLPEFATGEKYRAQEPSRRARLNSDRKDQFVLCRITIEQVFGKDGRVIARRGGSK